MQTGRDGLGSAGFTRNDLPELVNRALDLLNELREMSDGPERAEKLEEFCELTSLMRFIGIEN